MNAPPSVRDASASPPRLVVYAHTWGLLELPRLPRGRAWSFEEALDHVAEAGYDGVQGEPERGAAILGRGLRFAAGGRVSTPGEAEPFLRRCGAAGAECATVHLGWGTEPDAHADILVGALLDASARTAVPAYVETHRATVAQDLRRTLDLVERIPEIRFNLDFSHLYCGGEAVYRGFEAVRPLLTPILERTRFFHGRVSNGEAMQVSLADPENAPHLAAFERVWEDAMRAWVAVARPGELLPFAPELGPPSSGYSLTYLDADGERHEIADRWAESLRLAESARAAFRRAAARSRSA